MVRLRHNTFLVLYIFSVRGRGVFFFAAVDLIGVEIGMKSGGASLCRT